MSESFDAYRKWLGIQPKDRPKDQPPNHYRLLALELFEEDADAISNAADRQMAHVRTFQAGPHSALSQKILNELSAARVCLLNREKKAEYDAALRRELALQLPAASAAAVPRAAPLPAALLHAPLPAAGRLATSAAVIPVQAPHPGPAPAPVVLPSLDPAAAPFVRRTSRYAARSRGAGWQVPAAVVATIALLAGAAYVVTELGRTIGEGTPPSESPNAVATPQPQPSHPKPHHPKPTTTPKKADLVKADSTKPLPPQRDPASQATASASSQTNRKPPRGRSGSGGTINLLKLIDPKRDAVSGDWRFDGNQLITPSGGGLHCLRLPYSPPAEYTLRLVAERLPGDSGAIRTLHVGLASGKTQFLVAFDANEKSGLERLDGQVWSNNETTVEGWQFSLGVPTTVTCTVRPSAVRVLIDSQTIIDWNGDFKRLSLHPVWGAVGEGRLFLGCQCGYRISKLELAPLAREPSSPGIASSQAPPLLNGQIDLLDKIDVKRDAVAGEWKRDAEGLVSPAGGLARLRIPYAVGEEYVVTVEVERLSGNEAFGVGLASGERWTVAWLDGRKSFGTGLDGIDGSARDKPARRLPTGKRTTLAYCVRRTGMVLLQPADGTSVSWQGLIDWKGDFGAWNWPVGWDAPEKGRLELISSQSRFRIRRCLLMPVTDWKPDDGNVARVAKGMTPQAGGKPVEAVNPRAPLGKLLSVEEKKSPVPSADALAAARRAAEEKFQGELQTAKAPLHKLTIARKVLGAALDAKPDSAERYALVDLARELAAKGGSSKVAIEAIDELVKLFEIDDELSLRVETLEGVKAPAGSAGKGAKKEQYDSARDLIDACVAEDRFPEATRAAVIAQAAARVLNDQDPGLARQIADERKELDRLAKAYAAIKDERERLKTDEQDPEANLAVGKFYCLVKDDWQRGLPHLAAGGDAELKELAQRELAKPNGADEERLLGDAWWELSRKERSHHKAALAGRAGFWYRRAVTFLGGIEKDDVEKRLKEIGGSGRPDKSQFLSGLMEKNVRVQNNWFGKGQNTAEKQPIRVNGKESPHGLFMHAPRNGFASVSYDLDRKARWLSFEVAIDDKAGNGRRTPLVFQVFGDGEILWTSAPIVDKRVSVSGELKVSNVRTLELRVNCPGTEAWAYAVWLEPKVTWK